MPDYNKVFLNQYATVYTSTTGSGGVFFGFQAGLVKVINDGAGIVLLTAAATGGATTNDFQLSSGETLELREVSGTFGLGFKATGASTAGPSVRVGAWG